MKVLITTSGVGSRLGDLTKYTNKAIVKIGDKAAISYIIESYPGAEFVITLGHFGSHVRQFLELMYPNLKFEFVEVFPYQGVGSGLLKSLSFVKDRLQCPFIFHVCDTILKDIPPPPDKNWMACIESDRPDFFRTLCVNGTKVTKVNEKGEINYDYAYIGVAGVFDYKLFWLELEQKLKENIIDSSDCHVFREMLLKTDIHYWRTEDYYDTGSVENLREARNFYKQDYKILDKPEESIYFNANTVIKFFSDFSLCKNRVIRANKLKGLVPNILGSTENFYKYELVEGLLLSRVITEQKTKQLIEWAGQELWTPVETNSNMFKAQCESFYISKTNERVIKYLTLTKTEDKKDIINECKIPSLKDLFKKIDWRCICNAVSVRFHGDFILDNILYVDSLFSDSKKSFVLLDWRQEFGGSVDAGDKYYDLAKLNHNLTVNHDIISDNNFFVKFKNGNVYCDILRSHNMVQCQQAFFDTVESLGYDLKKINIMTALIWLNMAPLHEYPFNKFLFYFGKYNLWRELND